MKQSCINPMRLLFLRMANLRLARTMRYFGIGDSNDYVVLDGGRVIGRIMLHPQASEDQPWFWTITAVEYPPSVYNMGYSATREQAWRISRRNGWHKRHRKEPRDWGSPRLLLPSGEW
jgi:hypothetical protein